jgi:hypothetical protein
MAVEVGKSTLSYCADFLATEMMQVGKSVSVLAVHSTSTTSTA